MKWWILIGQTPIEVTMDEWSTWFELGKHVIWQTKVGEKTVSTIFLGIDHSFEPDAEIPVLFETMVFNGGSLLEAKQRRYRSYLDAEAGHKAAVRSAKARKKTT